jgi:hypothetical protein
MGRFTPTGCRQVQSPSHADLGSYDTNHLIDTILDHLDLPDDAALAKAMGVDPQILADLRSMRREVDAAMLILCHKMTGISINGLRNILGDRRWRIRRKVSLVRPLV